MPPNETKVTNLDDDCEPLLPGSSLIANRDHEFRGVGCTTPLHHLCLGIRRSSIYLVVFLLFFVLYLALGGLVFGSMEQPMEMQARLEIRNRIEKFLFKYPVLSGFIIILFFPPFLLDLVSPDAPSSQSLDEWDLSSDSLEFVGSKALQGQKDLGFLLKIFALIII